MSIFTRLERVRRRVRQKLTSEKGTQVDLCNRRISGLQKGRANNLEEHAIGLRRQSKEIFPTRIFPPFGRHRWDLGIHIEEEEDELE